MLGLDDVELFLNPDEFGVFAVLPNQQKIVVLFDANPISTELGQFDYDSDQPSITGRAQDLATLTPGDQMSIGTQAYRVERHPTLDGAGLATLKLSPIEA
jgi:hypothetical protein